MATTQELVNAVRVMSGLRNNQLFTDPQIAELLTDAALELYDVFVVSYAHWFKATFNFTLTGGVGANVLDLAADVPDLQMIQGLNLNPASSQPTSVPMLGSFAERNGVTVGALGICTDGRQYHANGDELEILPAAQAAGDYQLIYTRQMPALNIPAIEAVSGVGGTASVGGVLFVPLGAFDASYVGGFVTLSTSANGNDGRYTVTSVIDATHLAFGHFFNSELLDTVGIFIAKPANFGVLTVPQILAPWVLFLKVHASIAIRTSRQQDTAELQAKLAQQRARLVAMSATRSEGVTQAPMTRHGRSGHHGDPGGHW